MRLLSLVLVLFIQTFSIADAQDFVPMGILYRVKKIAVGPATASTFLIEVDNRQYLVTAKHVVATINGDQGDVDLFVGDGRRIKVSVKILRCKDPIDIAVLVPPSPLMASLDPSLVSDGKVTFSQSLFFIGFPYGDDQLTTRLEETSAGFIRKATMSALEHGDGWFRLLLDGTNNAGFSGGPVIYRDQNEQGHPLKIIGVISGYRPDITQVMKMVPVQESEITADDIATNRIVTLGNGEKRRLVGTDNVVMNNSGIVHAYGLQAAIDLIRASGGPGPEVKPEGK
jgi:Trypsin-like peptidase domain